METGHMWTELLEFLVSDKSLEEERLSEEETDKASNSRTINDFRVYDIII
jgi:hypothetical protein